MFVATATQPLGQSIHSLMTYICLPFNLPLKNRTVGNFHRRGNSKRKKKCIVGYSTFIFVRIQQAISFLIENNGKITFYTELN